MVSEAQRELIELKPEHDFFVGIDSDGCVFDTMGIKQRECFCPWMIGYFNLQGVALAARECKDFADLFSKTRGANRHITAKRIISELLPSHPMVKIRKFKVPQFPYYFEWVDNPDSLLSNEGLEKAIKAAKNDDERKELELALAWSKKVNLSVKEIVKNIPPFPFVRESLEKLSKKVDMIVVSSTPTEALQREWEEHDVAEYMKVIAGQEMGKKKEHLQLAAGGKYEEDHILMIGDAPGDLKAAQANNALFYPIIPGNEEKSWELFYKEGIQRFLDGNFKGDYATSLLDEFDKSLPENPPWS
jgi:phosphoglycolate phosphatase-like HAD superfamily hydrolase